MSPESKETLRKCFEGLQEPHKSILQRRISNDEIANSLLEIANRFNLSDEQRNPFELEAMLVLLGVTPQEDLKDNLIADAGLSYETAVRVQRAFEREILQSYLDEAEAIQKETPPPLPPEEDQERMLFDGKDPKRGPRFTVTNERLIIDDDVYPIGALSHAVANTSTGSLIMGKLGLAKECWFIFIFVNFERDGTWDRESIELFGNGFYREDFATPLTEAINSAIAAYRTAHDPRSNLDV